MYFIVNFFRMSKIGGLQLVKPTFDWSSRDKLMEIEKFKGPICDLKDKQ